jgi:hypothetical protein
MPRQRLDPEPGIERAAVLYRHVLDRERKVYQEVPDPDAAKQDLIRVIDESGEDYLFPRELFLPVELSGEAREAILRAS